MIANRFEMRPGAYGTIIPFRCARFPRVKVHSVGRDDRKVLNPFETVRGATSTSVCPNEACRVCGNILGAYLEHARHSLRDAQNCINVY